MDLEALKKQFSVSLHPLLKIAYLIVLPLMIYFFIQTLNHQAQAEALFLLFLGFLVMLFVITIFQYLKPLMKVRDEQALFVFRYLCKRYCTRLNKNYEFLPLGAGKTDFSHKAFRRGQLMPSPHLFLQDQESNYGLYYVSYQSKNANIRGFMFEYPKYQKGKQIAPDRLIGQLDKQYDAKLAFSLEIDNRYYVFYDVKKIIPFTFYLYYVRYTAKEKERIEAFASEMFTFFTHMISRVQKAQGARR